MQLITLLALAAGAVFAASTPDESAGLPANVADNSNPSAVPCGCPLRLPFLRSYNGRDVDHFYTVNGPETHNAVTYLGYNFEDVTGLVDFNKQPNNVPLFRLYSGSASDHFYTTDAAERDRAINLYGYTYEGIAGYVYRSAICGAAPLYRAYSGGGGDHFYTMSLNEKNNAVSSLGYADEGIAAFIIPAPR